MNNIDYYIYVNGFIDKTDANNIDFFKKLLLKTKLYNYKITNDLNIANDISVVYIIKYHFSNNDEMEPISTLVESKTNDYVNHHAIR